MLLVDARQGVDGDTSQIVERLATSGRRATLALNKIDLVRRDRLLGLAGELSRRFAFDRVFMISGLTGDGVDDLKRYLASAVPEGPFLFPEDQLSNVPERLLAADSRMSETGDWVSTITMRYAGTTRPEAGRP